MAAKVFVYGTLRKGAPNYSKTLASETARLVGMAHTSERYPMRLLSRYNVPFLLRKPGVGQQVVGEVYEVDEAMLSKLDYLGKLAKKSLISSGKASSAFYSLDQRGIHTFTSARLSR